jgi:gluconate 2-dehydrogenase gamma chain
MMDETATRREFLSTSARIAGGGWLLASLPALSTMAACARDDAGKGAPFRVFTPEEGRAISAFAEQIFPSDDEYPGAVEAGAPWFIDRALESFFSDMLPPIREGLADLDRRARRSDRRRFADLPPDRQIALMTEVEDTVFFSLSRMLTLLGVFSDPSYGGNKDGVGWEILKMEHHPVYQPPFGHYDAEYGKGSAS